MGLQGFLGIVHRSSLGIHMYRDVVASLLSLASLLIFLIQRLFSHSLCTCLLFARSALCVSSPCLRSLLSCEMRRCCSGCILRYFSQFPFRVVGMTSIVSEGLCFVCASHYFQCRRRTFVTQFFLLTRPLLVFTAIPKVSRCRAKLDAINLIESSLPKSMGLFVFMPGRYIIF